MYENMWHLIIIYVYIGVSKKTGEPEPEPKNREIENRGPGSDSGLKKPKTGCPGSGTWFLVPGFFTRVKYIFFYFLFFLCGQHYIWEIFARSEIGVGEHLVYVGILFLFDEDLIEKTKTKPRYVKASSLNKIGIGFLISRWMLWLKT
jgi:hypothetical protein